MFTHFACVNIIKIKIILKIEENKLMVMHIVDDNVGLLEVGFIMYKFGFQ